MLLLLYASPYSFTQSFPGQSIKSVLHLGFSNSLDDSFISRWQQFGPSKLSREASFLMQVHLDAYTNHPIDDANVATAFEGNVADVADVGIASKQPSWTPGNFAPFLVELLVERSETEKVFRRWQETCCSYDA